MMTLFISGNKPCSDWWGPHLQTILSLSQQPYKKGFLWHLTLAWHC